MPRPTESLTSSTNDADIKQAISQCISIQVHEGMKQEQAIAMCHSEARTKTGKKLKSKSITVGK